MKKKIILLVTFRVELNSREITNWTNANNATLSNVITHVMVHELGHTIGLADGDNIHRPLGGSHNGSVMNWNSDPNTVRVPTTFDNQSVNLLYR